MQTERSDAQEAAAEAPSPPQTRSLHILIVDGLHLNVKMATRLLGDSRWGMHHTTVGATGTNCGQNALDILHASMQPFSQRIDLLLIGQISGTGPFNEYETIRRIRRAETEAAALFANDDQEEQKEALFVAPYRVNIVNWTGDGMGREEAFSAGSDGFFIKGGNFRADFNAIVEALHFADID